VRGVVVRTFSDKGYVFVKGPDGISRFVHATYVQWGMFDTLQTGTKVEFTPDMGPKGPIAKDVTPIMEEE